MSRILLTAFKPFADWDQNSSWLALQALMRDLPPSTDVTTRLYPVDYDEVRSRLAADLQGSFDVVLHIGQSSGSPVIQLEQFALNACRVVGESQEIIRPLEENGPLAYSSALPLGDWTRRLREYGIPTVLSLHAGDYLCNASMYWSHYLLEAAGQTARVGFVHLPLDTSQVVTQPKAMPSLPSEVCATALRMLVSWAGELVDYSAAFTSSQPTLEGQA
jgi:pyroglutamyl-peptidase